MDTKIEEVVKDIQKQLDATKARRKAMATNEELAAFWNDDYEKGQEIGLFYALAALSKYGFKITT